ncbi:MAG: ferrous iron transporter B, partial [Candidatus Omnitrophota bacterium]
MQHKFAKPYGYDDPLELYLSRIIAFLKSDYRITQRAVALLLLQEDEEILAEVEKREQDFPVIRMIVNEAKRYYSQPLSYLISLRRQQETNLLCRRSVSFPQKEKIPFKERLSRLMMNPFFGGPLLLAVLYYFLYKFVGVFGAGVLVNFLEDHLIISRL